MPVKFSDLEPKMKQILSIYPVRNQVKWLKKDDQVVLIYPKDLSNFEAWLQKRIGGPEMIKRPMDDVGSKIWIMCDGKHTVNDICTELDEIYHEDIEPVLDRVSKFLEVLVKSNLIRLSKKPVNPKKLRVVKNK
jgi:hypothetical protein